MHATLSLLIDFENSINNSKFRVRKRRSAGRRVRWRTSCISLVGTSFRSPVPPTRRFRFSPRSPNPPSIIAALRSESSGREVLRRPAHGVQDHEARDHLSGPGTGAWEAALVNTLSPGDKVLMFETGVFSTLWKKMADRLGIECRSSSKAIGAPGADAGDRVQAVAGQGARDQGRRGRAQRNVDRSGIQHCRRSSGDRRRRPPRPTPRRHDLLARLDRLPARGVGGRRHRRGVGRD